jgi:hypothetical protein
VSLPSADLDVNQKKSGGVTFNSQESISVNAPLEPGECHFNQGSGGSALAAGCEHSENFAQSLANVFQFCSGTGREREGGLFLVPLDLCPKVLACAGNGETFFVKKFLNAQNTFYVFVTVHSLPRAAFDRLELGEFSFPEAQNIGRQAAETGDLADPKIKFLWDHHIGGPGGLGDGSGA